LHSALHPLRTRRFGKCWNTQNSKNKHPFLPIILTAATIILVGYGQSDSPTSATPTVPATEAKSRVDPAAGTVKSTGTGVTAEVSKKVDSAILEAQNFIGQGKLQDAMGSLNKLSSISLTPAQAQTVDGLKTKIETAMTAAGKAVDSAKTAVGQASSAIQIKVTETVSAAQSLLKDGKFQDALTSLKGLSDRNLSADQSQLVGDLKAQIQAAMDATKGAGADATTTASGIFKK
jgi:hypothetical protein